MIARAGSSLPAVCGLLDDERAGGDSEAPPGLLDPGLFEPAREFLRRPGKVFRARVVEIAWSLAGGAPGACPRELPLFLEIVHAGSLIVDDVEDGSGERRGAPALHRIYGAPVALNTGNWMYFWALSLLERMNLESERELQVHRLAVRSLERCHRGQALDLAVPVTEVPQGRLREAVRAATALKTGTLVDLAASSAALAAGAGVRRAAELGAIGCELGVGLQMLDDLGAVCSDRRLEKGLEDLQGLRLTWPWVWLAEELDAPAFERLRRLARRVARGGGDPGDLFARMRLHLAGAHGLHVRPHWDRLLARLGELPGDAGSRQALERVIRQLEESYG